MENQNQNPMGHDPMQSPLNFGDNNNNGGKKQALFNVGIFIAIFIVLLAGVKLASWSAEKLASDKADKNEDQTASVIEVVEDTMKKEESSEDKSVMVLSEKGEVVLQMSSKKDSIVREVYLYNAAKESWILIYDGYKTLAAGGAPVEVYRATLAPLSYDKVRVRTVEEVVDLNRSVMVSGGASQNLVIEL